MDCEVTDWFLVLLVTLVCIGLYAFDRKDKFELLVKVVVYAILINYFLAFLYIDFLAEYVTESAGRWALTVAIVVALLAIGFFSYREIAFTFALILMISRGLPIYAALPFGFIIAVVVGFILVCGKLSDLAEMISDSAALSMDIAIGLVSIFANANDSNARMECSTKHINMVLLCDAHCQTVVTDDTTSNRAYWIILAGVLTACRVGYVYYNTVCNRPTPQMEQDRKRCCPCLQKRTYKEMSAQALDGVVKTIKNRQSTKPTDDEPDPNKHFGVTENDNDNDSEAQHTEEGDDEDEESAKNNTTDDDEKAATGGDEDDDGIDHEQISREVHAPTPPTESKRSNVEVVLA